MSARCDIIYRRHTFALGYSQPESAPCAARWGISSRMSNRMRMRNMYIFIYCDRLARVGSAREISSSASLFALLLRSMLSRVLRGVLHRADV